MLERRYSILLYILLHSFFLMAQKGAMISVDSLMFKINATPYFSFSPTTLNEIDLKEVAFFEKNAPQPCGLEALSLGFRHQRILARFQINAKNDENTFLGFSEKLYNFSKLYQLKDNQLVLIEALSNEPSGWGVFLSKNLVYQLRLKKGEIHTYYLLTEYTLVTSLKFHLGKSESFVKENVQDGLINGIMLGIIIAVMFINLVLALLTKEKELWYNFAFSLGLLFVSFLLSGLSIGFIAKIANNIHLVELFGNFAGAMSIFFVNSFFIKVEKKSWIDYCYRIFLLFYSISAMVSFIPFWNNYAMPILEVNAFLSMLYFILLAYSHYQKNDSNILLFVIGFASVFLFAAYFALQFNKVITPTFTSAIAFTVCVNLFTFFLTSACVAKIVITRREKDDELLHEKENLERNVLNRTEELNIALSQANENEEKYRLLADNTKDLVAIHGLDCSLKYVAPSIQYYGYENTEAIIGKPLHEFVHPNDIQLLLEVATKSLGNKQSTVFEYRLYNPSNDSYLWMEGSGGVIFNEKDEPESFLVTSRNIQLRKETDAKIEIYTRELERSNTELQNFAHVASHDIKSPLRTVYSFLQLLERKNKEKYDDTDREYLGYVMDSVYQMNMLIDNVLAYAKVGKNIGDAKNIVFSDIQQMVVRNLNTIIQEKKATLHWEQLPETIKGHLPTLIQIFQNFVNNGLKYNTSEQPQVSISSTLDAHKNVVYCIKDNGIGIEKEFHQTIFEMFSRLHPHSIYEGTGVGLALCSRLVEHYGGAIWLESDIGNGSAFYFTLPLTEC